MTARPKANPRKGSIKSTPATKPKSNGSKKVTPKGK